jgi:hypothetical protein
VSLAEHEPSIGKSDEWYTPPYYFEALGLTFDLDPCSPGAHHWVPARRVYTRADDGLSLPWHGMVFVNPPFGGRAGHVPWLRKFFEHGNGIALVRAYTSADWFHDYVAPRAETLLFPRGKTKFVRGEAMTSVDRKGNVTRHLAGTIGTSPGHGVVLIGMGARANAALRRCGIGLFIRNDYRDCYLGLPLAPAAAIEAENILVGEG